MTIRIRAQYTRYPHWGAVSGPYHFAHYLDPGRFTIRLYDASDSDADLPLPSAALRRWLRRRVQRRGMQWYKLSDLNAELRALKKCLTGRFDIVHFIDGEHTGQYLPEWRDRLGLKRLKLVATYHQPSAALGDLVIKDVVARYDRIILLSPAQQSFFREFMPAEKLVTILHGINTDFWIPNPAPIDAGVFRCVTAGHYLRDWQTLRGVAERLSSDRTIEFHIVTNRDTGLEGLANVVHHRDIDDDALRIVYQTGSVLLLPLHDATANNTLLEGIACGLPVVSTELPSVRAYVSDDQAILLGGGNVEGMVDAVLRLRKDAAMRAWMAANARARAEMLSWRRVAGAYEALYAGLTENSHS
jgi:glycosyltransferase involved in cell wall biosynthesis